MACLSWDPRRKFSGGFARAYRISRPPCNPIIPSVPLPGRLPPRRNPPPTVTPTPLPSFPRRRESKNETTRSAGLTRQAISINDRATVSSHHAKAPGQSIEPAWKSPRGDSILYCDDALNVLTQIPDESVDCVWTDPPYLLSNGGITCVGGHMVSVDKGDWDKSRGIDADYQFNEEWTSECYRVLKPTGTIWVSGTLHIYPIVGMALLRNGFRLLNDIIWEKTNPPPNLGRRTFTHSTEVVLWASKASKGSRHKYTFNYDEMRRENGGKQMKTVWRMAAAGREEKQFGKHPTQKPVALIDRCLRASTRPGDVVLDPFAGSGSTGVAAMKIQRRFIGIEIEEPFVEIGVMRLSQVTPPPPPPPPQVGSEQYRHEKREHRAPRGSASSTQRTREH